MKKNLINTENWTSSYFLSSPLRAFVSIGADLINGSEAEIQYLVTVTDQDYQELFQSIHLELSQALQILNDKYGHWELKDPFVKADSEGCDSCAAH